MAYARSFAVDVFVSFASVDNQPLRKKEKGWVTRFIEDLEVAINLELGDKIQIFFGEQAQGHRLSNDELRDRIRSSAVFVPLLSLAYSSREWAELSVFTTEPESEDRLVPVEMFPIRDGNYPPPIAGTELILFWVSEKGRVRRLTYEDDPEAYTQNLARLTKRVTKILKELRSSAPPEELPPRVSEPEPLADFRDLEALKEILKRAEQEFSKEADDYNEGDDLRDGSGD
jgi:hypothetical protein